jgi:hypothetical protein
MGRVDAMRAFSQTGDYILDYLISIVNCSSCDARAPSEEDLPFFGACAAHKYAKSEAVK